MLNPEVERTGRNVRGRGRHKIVYKFLFNPYGFNTLPDGRGSFGAATFGGQLPLPDGSNLLYRPGRFGDLFKQPPPVAYQVSGIG